MIQINKSIRDRASTVFFSNKEVDVNALNQILEAARWAPSSRNQQPWRFVMAQRGKGDLFEKILNCLNEGNIEWAQNAPIFIVSIAEIISSYKNTPNRYAWHDVGMANALLMIQATELGMHTHPMGGFDAEALSDQLFLDNTLEPVCVIALGFKDENFEFSKNLILKENKKRERKPIEELILNIDGVIDFKISE